MKTGTTYLQSMLMENSAALLAAGHVQARLLGRPGGAASHVLARPKTPEAQLPWRTLTTKVREVNADSVVLSTEFLSYAKRHQADALLTPLEGMQIEVVLVVRNQAKTIASQFQTFCRNYGDATWPEYLAQIDPARGGHRGTKAWKTYYRAQNIERILAVWTEDPRVSKVSVIVMPRERQHSRHLWDQFAEAAGLSEIAVTEPTGQVNPSVGHASAQMLQDLGRYWQQAGENISFVRPSMRPFIYAALVPRRRLETTPELDRAGWDFATRRNVAAAEAIRAGLATGKVQLLGDLDDLDAGPCPQDLPEQAPDANRQLVRDAAQALWVEARLQAGLPPKRPPVGYQRTLKGIARTIPLTPAWSDAHVPPQSVPDNAAAV